MSDHAELLAIHHAVMNPMEAKPQEGDSYTVRRVKEFIQRATNNAAPQVGAGSSADPATKNGELAVAAPNEDFDLDEFNTLAKFYNVRTLSDLVRIQAEHIESLQAKLPKTPPFPGINRVREG